MSQSANQLSASDRVILDETRHVFGDVDRGSGVTLHETEVIDMYGSADAREQARRKDTDHHWWEVRDEWIDQFGGVGGLSFLDEAGFRYYLPAYMSYWIRTGEEPNSLAFHLRSNDRLDLDGIFTPAEKKLIARFLDYVCQRFEDEAARETLDGFWRRYLDAPDGT